MTTTHCSQCGLLTAPIGDNHGNHVNQLNDGRCVDCWAKLAKRLYDDAEWQKRTIQAHLEIVRLANLAHLEIVEATQRCARMDMGIGKDATP